MPRFAENGIISLVGAAPRYDLGESLGPDLFLGDLLDADALAGQRLGYGSAAGEPGLRRLIADRHGVGPDDVVVTIGGVHALFLLAFLLCERGDEAVVARPVFPPARAALEAVGATVRTVGLRFDDGYRLDPAALRACLSPRTRLVSLASPQNPSGVALPAATIVQVLADMAAVCPEARLLVDETYREAVHGDDRPAPSLATLDPRVVSVASLSKCHGAPGLRIGWALTRDRALREQLVLAKFNTVIACPAVDEALAERVLAQSDRIVADRRGRLAAGRDRVAAWVAGQPDLVEWVRPDAGALCCIRLAAAFDAAALARLPAALDAAGVRLADGAWFGDEPRVFRLGFGLLPPDALDAALAGLGRALQAALAGETVR